MVMKEPHSSVTSQNYPWANPFFISSKTFGKMHRFGRYKMKSFQCSDIPGAPISETRKVCKTWTFSSFSLDIFFLRRGKCFYSQKSVKLRRKISAQELLHLGRINLHQPQRRWQFHAIITRQDTRARATGLGAEQQTHHALFSKIFTANVKFWPLHFIKRIIP